MLQPIAKSMPTFFKDSYVFNELINNFQAPIGARSFIADVVVMFPNIKAPTAKSIISPYLLAKEKESGHYHAEALIKTLEIVMDKHIVQFVDLCCK